MSDPLKTIRRRHKCATMPVPGVMWDGLPVMAQLAMLQMESAKFMAAMHQQEVGGFRIVVIRDGREPELVLAVGEGPEEHSGLIVPDKRILTN